MIVLDTHVLIWLRKGSDELGQNARAVIDAALAEDALAVSAISFWEVAMLVRKGRMALILDVVEWRLELLRSGLLELSLDGRCGIDSVDLPDLHADPADRMIIAATQQAGGTLLTADARILSWAERRALVVRDARS